jgi:hypothetical protein
MTNIFELNSIFISVLWCLGIIVVFIYLIAFFYIFSEYRDLSHRVKHTKGYENQEWDEEDIAQALRFRHDVFNALLWPRYLLYAFWPFIHVFKIFYIIIEGQKQHQKLSRKRAMERALK